MTSFTNVSVFEWDFAFPLCQIDFSFFRIIQRRHKVDSETTMDLKWIFRRKMWLNPYPYNTAAILCLLLTYFTYLYCFALAQIEKSPFREVKADCSWMFCSVLQLSGDAAANLLALCYSVLATQHSSSFGEIGIAYLPCRSHWSWGRAKGLFLL